MPELGRWFEQEYARLRAEGKAVLVDQLEPLLNAIADGQYGTAMGLISDLYLLVDALGEPIWRVVVDYYAGMANIAWRGNLAAGLDVTTNADLRACRLVGSGHVLELHLREALLYAWLNVDEPGYAPDILAAVDELSMGHMSVALAVRFKLLRAFALAGYGDPQSGYTLLLAALADIDWPMPYHHRNRGCALAWVGRLDEAAECYHLAMVGYEEQGLSIDGNASRLDLGDALLRLGRVEDALDILRAALSSAEHSPNAFQVGKALGLLGLGLARQGDAEAGALRLTAALEKLDGLGWLRLEAELALEHLRMLAQMSIGRRSDEWLLAKSRAERAVRRLKSKDLPAQLVELDSS